MSNNSNPNYFRLGIFVLAAIGVLVAVILIFGSGKFFRSSFYVETYIKPVSYTHLTLPTNREV